MAKRSKRRRNREQRTRKRRSARSAQRRLMVEGLEARWLLTTLYDFSSTNFASFEGNASNTTNVVMLSRDDDSTAEVIDVELTGVSATAGTDFTSGPVTVSFAVGETVKEVPIEILGEQLIEADEIVDLSLTGFSGSGQAGSINPTATLSITNDDSATVSISDATVVEGNPGDTTQLVFDVALDNPIDADVTFDYETQDGTALSGQDFGFQSGTVTILAGDTSAQITVDVTEDLVVELDENLTLLAHNLQAAGREVTLAGPGTGAGFELLDDFQAGLVGDDLGGTTAANGQQWSVNGPLFVFASDPADSGNTVLTNSSSVSSDKNALLPVSATGTGTGTTVTMFYRLKAEELSGYSAFVGLFDGAGTANQLKTSVTHLIDGPGVQALWAGNRNVQTLQTDQWYDVWMVLDLADNTNPQTNDTMKAFIAGPGISGQVPLTHGAGDEFGFNSYGGVGMTELMIFAGGGSQSANNFYIDDVYLDFSGENLTSPLAVSATGTITNDDSATVSIDDVSQSETDGLTTFTFTLSLTGEVDADVSVDYQTADGTAVEAAASVGSDDYDTAAGTATISAGATSTTIEVTVNGDEVVELDETFLVDLLAGTLAAGGRDVIIADAQGEGTIDDNDSPALITVGGAGLGEGVGLYNVIATLDKAVQGGVVVDVIFTDVTADGSDYNSTVTSISFNGIAGETVSIPVNIVDDLVVENNESFRVTMANAVGAGTIQTGGPATINITDNDLPATITLDDVTVQEDDGTISVIATLDKAVQGGVTADVVLSDGTADGADYTINTTAITFTGTAGETVSIDIDITDDLVVENSEDLTVSLINVAGAGTINGSDTATVTIDDNDSSDAPIITSLSLAAVIDETYKDGSDNRRTVELSTNGDGAIVGQKLILTGQFDDMDLTDSHTVTVNWDDGTVETFDVADVDIDSDGRSFELSHRYASAGTYSVSVTVNDGSALDVTALGFDVNRTALQGGILAIAGSEGDDEIAVFRKWGGQIKVKIRQHGVGTEFVTTNLSNVSEIVVLGLGGDDFIAISHALSLPTVLDGGNGDDAIIGGRGADKLIGGDGNDLLFGRNGDDTMLGGMGHDLLKGNDGDDCLDGGDGNDAIAGGSGQDTLTGGDGRDAIWGQNSNDIIYGNYGNDWLSGGNGDDLIYGGEGDDAIWGGNGDDTIFGGDGNDWIFGENGDDILIGEDGNDRLFGGNGNDDIDGGEGSDWIDGGNGNDMIDGGAGDDIIFGGRGDDTVEGGVDRDHVFSRWSWVWC